MIVVLVGGVLAVQALLVLGYLAVSNLAGERFARSSKSSEVVGSGLGVLLVTMWIMLLALLSVGGSPSD